MATKFSTAASATAFTSAHNCSSSVSALRVVKISEKRVSVPAVTSFSIPSALLISPMASRYPFARSRFTLMEASGAPMFTTVSASSVLPREMVAFTSFFSLSSKNAKLRGMREVYSKYREFTLLISTVISRPLRSCSARP